jgi:hypothetical protein
MWVLLLAIDKNTCCGARNFRTRSGYSTPIIYKAADDGTHVVVAGAGMMNQAFRK